MKIVCVIPIYGRQAVTLETLRLLKEQTLELYKIITVGSTAEDAQTAEIADVEYLHYENNPLSDKVQAGVSHARQYDPDALLTTGSDSWLTRNFCETLSVYLRQGAHLVGKTQSYSCKANPNEGIEILKHKYRRRTDPIGGGRFFSSEALAFLDWKIYPAGLNKGLDGYSYHRITTGIKGLKMSIGNEFEDAFSMDIKSNTWANITTFAVIKRFHHELYLDSVPYPEMWIERHYPGSLESLKVIVPGIRI